MTDKKIKVTFYGGVGWVTGANFLLENVVPEGQKSTKILIDCGMFQGGEDAEALNREPFHYDPSEIDYLFVTHAHADHIGRIPKLVKDGFRGKIYSSEATLDLSEVMLADSLKIISYDAKKRSIDPLYEEKDVAQALELWEHIDADKPFEFPGGFSMTLHDAGHILGSYIAKFHYGNKNMVFTGDLGNSPDPLLRDTADITDADYMLMESVYGDRNHEEREERISKFKNAILDTIDKQGILMIPSFALERTQNLLYILNELVESGEVPQIPVFLDSPLAINVTNVFRKHTDLLNQDVQNTLEKDSDVFDFPGLKETYTIDDSKAIMRINSPKIIISSAGMSHAGRIIHHEKQYLDDPKNTLLFVGYQSVGTLGRIIQDGAKKVNILGKDVEIKATIKTITGYSGHKDSDNLVDFVSKSANRLKKVFVCMGETKSSLFLVQRLRDYLGVNAVAPDVDESVILDMN